MTSLWDRMGPVPFASFPRNDNIDGKFDPDDSRKMNLTLALFLKKDERLAMEEDMSKYLFSAHWMKSFEELKQYKETHGDVFQKNTRHLVNGQAIKGKKKAY